MDRPERRQPRGRRAYWRGGEDDGLCGGVTSAGFEFLLPLSSVRLHFPESWCVLCHRLIALSRVTDDTRRAKAPLLRSSQKVQWFAKLNLSPRSSDSVWVELLVILQSQ